MTTTSSEPPVRRARRTRWAVAAALLVVGGACLAFGLQSQPRSLATPHTPRVSPPHVSPPHATAGSTKSAPTNVVVAPLTVRSAPLQLHIPAIGLSQPLATLGVNANGTVQVPTNIQQPGWYQFGPSPGEVGSAVILGHVDSYRGAAVFFKLRDLVPGDLVGVTLADGGTAQFKVTSVAMYLKTKFPAQLVYSSLGASSLNLVTCGGVFDSHTGHYLSNVVVYSSLVATTPATIPVPAATTAATGSGVTPGL
jgi:sortase (surface protein transpeptidase)